MIARLWHGVVPDSRSGAYLARMRNIALADYRTTEGNRAAWCLSRREGGLTHVEMFTLWTNLDAIRRFAGDAYDRAKYYDFDPDFLVELEPRVQHYEVYASDSSNDDLMDAALGSADAALTARVWRGVVPTDKAEPYSQYLADVGFQDYRAHPGPCGVHLLRRLDGLRVHLLLLSLWTSREALVAYSGADIEQARYYPYDLECLIDPTPRVEVFDASSAPAGTGHLRAE